MNPLETQSETSSIGKHKRMKILAWTAVILIGAVAALAITFTVQKNIAYQSKVTSMTALADRIIPESDWKEVQRLGVLGGSDCVSFDQDCYVLHRSWSSEVPVDIEKMADQLEIPMEHTQYPEDCMRSINDGGRTEICAYESKSQENWQISLRIRQR